MGYFSALIPVRTPTFPPPPGRRAARHWPGFARLAPSEKPACGLSTPRIARAFLGNKLPLEPLCRLFLPSPEPGTRHQRRPANVSTKIDKRHPGPTSKSQRRPVFKAKKSRHPNSDEVVWPHVVDQVTWARWGADCEGVEAHCPRARSASAGSSRGRKVAQGDEGVWPS